MKKISRTCIAVIKNRRGKLLMVGDRRASWDWSLAQSMPRPKIQKRNELLLGATGDGALCTLVVDLLTIPKDKASDTDTFMFHQLRPAIEKLLINQGFKNEHNHLYIPADSDCEVLVGYSGKLYQVSIRSTTVQEHQYPTPSIITIDECNLPYAVGCGASTAIPILLAERRREGHSTKEHLQLAMEIVCEISPGCGPKEGGGFDFIGE